MKNKLLGFAAAAAIGMTTLTGFAQSQTKKPPLSPPAETSQT